MTDFTLWSYVTQTVQPLGSKRNPPPQWNMAIALSTCHRDIIDLHGLSVQEAYSKTQDFLKSAQQHGLKQATVITGKSGTIRDEFCYWIRYMEETGETTELNGGGAFLVKLKTLPTKRR